MKVRIKRAGTYSKFGLPHGKVGAQELKVGDVVELPDDYAAELIEKGMMGEYVKPKPRRKPRAKQVTPKADTERRIPSVTAEEALIRKE